MFRILAKALSELRLQEQETTPRVTHQENQLLKYETDTPTNTNSKQETTSRVIGLNHQKNQLIKYETNTPTEINFVAFNRHGNPRRMIRENNKKLITESDSKKTEAALVNMCRKDPSITRILGVLGDHTFSNRLFAILFPQRRHSSTADITQTLEMINSFDKTNHITKDETRLAINNANDIINNINSELQQQFPVSDRVKELPDEAIEQKHKSAAREQQELESRVNKLISQVQVERDYKKVAEEIKSLDAAIKTFETEHGEDQSSLKKRLQHVSTALLARATEQKNPKRIKYNHIVHHSPKTTQGTNESLIQTLEAEVEKVKQGEDRYIVISYQDHSGRPNILTIDLREFLFNQSTQNNVIQLVNNTMNQDVNPDLTFAFLSTTQATALSVITEVTPELDGESTKLLLKNISQHPPKELYQLKKEPLSANLQTLLELNDAVKKSGLPSLINLHNKNHRLLIDTIDSKLTRMKEEKRQFTGDELSGLDDLKNRILPLLIKANSPDSPPNPQTEPFPWEDDKELEYSNPWDKPTLLDPGSSSSGKTTPEDDTLSPKSSDDRITPPPSPVRGAKKVAGTSVTEHPLSEEQTTTQGTKPPEKVHVEDQGQKSPIDPRKGNKELIIDSLTEIDALAGQIIGLSGDEKFKNHRDIVYALGLQIRDRLDIFSKNFGDNEFCSFANDIRNYVNNTEKALEKEPGLWANFLRPIVNAMLSLINQIRVLCGAKSPGYGLYQSTSDIWKDKGFAEKLRDRLMEGNNLHDAATFEEQERDKEEKGSPHRPR